MRKSNFSLLLFGLLLTHTAHGMNFAGYSYNATEQEKEKREDEAVLHRWHVAELQRLTQEEENKRKIREIEYKRQQEELIKKELEQKKAQEEQFKKENGYLDDEIVDVVIESSPDKIKKLVDRFKLAETIQDKRKKERLIKSAILLVGKPGNGKSDLAKAFAQKVGRPFVIVEASMLGSKYQDSASENLKAAIDNAEKLGTEAVVIIEEISSLIDERKEGIRGDTNPGTTLLRIMDKYKNNKQIIFIATANDIKNLPAALQSRFDKCIIEIGLPDARQKECALKYYLKNEVDETVIKKIAANTEKFSLRNIFDLSEEISNYMVENHKQAISFDECKKIIKQITITEKPDDRTWDQIPWSEKNKRQKVAHYAKNTLINAGAVGAVVAGVNAGYALYDRYNESVKKTAEVVATTAVVCAGSTVAAPTPASAVLIAAGVKPVVAQAVVAKAGGVVTYAAGTISATITGSAVGTVVIVAVPVVAAGVVTYMIYRYCKSSPENNSEKVSNIA